MPSPTNPQDRKMEVLLRQQMQEHQHLISNYQKEMQTLRDSLSLAMERFDSLFGSSQQKLSEKTQNLSELVQGLQDKVKAHGVLSEDQKKNLLSIYQQLHDFHFVYPSKQHIENFKKDVDSRINDSTRSHISSFQDYQREIKVMLKALADEFYKFKVDTEEKFDLITELIKTNYDLCQIDKTGVLKEIKIREKGIFIIEKKIEHLYILIERINKRSDLCHKPESSI